MKRRGISLIVLIITIVVIIILATAIIVNIANTDIINKANEAVLKSRASSVEEAFRLWEMEKLMSSVSDKNPKPLITLLDELESQKLITAEERETVESTGKIEIGNKVIEVTKIHEIGTKEELEKFRDNVDSGNTYKNEIVKLTADIDLQCNAEDSSTWWDSIGSNDNSIRFEGIFDGNGFTVSGIYNEENENTDFSALFSGIYNATVKNLTAKGTLHVSDQVNVAVGGLIGIAIGKCEIINCINEIDVKKVSPGRETGGIVACTGYGVNDTGSNITISNCVNKGNVEGGNNCGGIVGCVYGTVNIDNCHNEGNVTTLVGNYIGGIVGRDGGETSNRITITNSYNTGTIYGLRQIGGIIGRVGNGNECYLYIDNCYNAGNIMTCERTSYAAFIGGILGRAVANSKEVKITNSYNTYDMVMDKSKQIAVLGGIVGRTEMGNTTIINCYNTGSLEADWTSGIVGLYTGNEATPPYLSVLNSYNAGNITARVKESGICIVQYDHLTANIENNYYLDTSASIGIDNYTTDGVTSYDEEYIKSEAFANLLNNNVKQMIQEKNLKVWKHNENSYPTF